MNASNTFIETLFDTDIDLVTAPFFAKNSKEPDPDHFRDLNILKLLNQAKFPVYLCQSKESAKYYAIKVFCSDDKKAQKCFSNESRFVGFNHPNIIKTVYVGKPKTIKHQGVPKQLSFLLMEYAPYGDLHRFVFHYREFITEKLVRTLFLQIAKGIEYLHEQDVAHLDLKLENLLIGEDFRIKIIDFDLACHVKDTVFHTIGSKFFRAPELQNLKCKDPLAADIYSAGVILFVLKSRGLAPHTEGSPWKGIDFLGLLNTNNTEFWEKHCEIQDKPSTFFSEDFKELFNGMTKVNPKERMTISEVLSSSYLMGDVFSQKELTELLGTFLKCF